MNKRNEGNPKAQDGVARMTRQRRVILEQMQTLGEHLTAEEVHERVRRWLPSISLGTVYRNLEILSTDGRIRKLDLGYDGPTLYDGGLRRHYHLRCVECGEVRDLPAEGFGDLGSAAAVSSDFEILDHDLTFEGLCPKCLKPVNHHR